jgi:hypothetical protein
MGFSDGRLAHSRWLFLSHLRLNGANHGQRSMVANRTLRGMSPEQDMTHIALIYTDQSITLLGGECDSYAFGFALPRGLFR